MLGLKVCAMTVGSPKMLLEITTVTPYPKPTESQTIKIDQQSGLSKPVACDVH